MAASTGAVASVGFGSVTDRGTNSCPGRFEVGAGSRTGRHAIHAHDRHALRHQVAEVGLEHQSRVEVHRRTDRATAVGDHQSPEAAEHEGGADAADVDGVRRADRIERGLLVLGATWRCAGADDDVGGSGEGDRVLEVVDARREVRGHRVVDRDRVLVGAREEHPARARPGRHHVAHRRRVVEAVGGQRRRPDLSAATRRVGDGEPRQPDRRRRTRRSCCRRCRSAWWTPPARWPSTGGAARRPSRSGP